MVFSAGIRFVLGLIVAFLGYLVAGELSVDPQLQGAIAALTALLASVGVVPPKPDELPAVLRNPSVSFALTTVVTAGVYAVTTLDMDVTLRGLIVAAIALLGSVGIVPPQAQRRPVA